MSTLLAWLAPWLLGIGSWLWLLGKPRGHAAWLGLAGGGWLLGMLLLGWLLWPLSTFISPQNLAPQLAIWLTLAGALLTASGWHWGQHHQDVSIRPQPTSWMTRALVAVLIALLAWHGWLLFAEASMRPLFPWDAWATWSIKPKTWFLLDRWVPFVDVAQWLASTPQEAWTSNAPAYPELLGRLQVWFASAAGCWCDPAFTVLWPALWLSMLLGSYGLLRGFGCRLLPTVMGLYALGSLPFLDIHTALAGYADLWLAVLFAFALLCWLPWQRSRHRGFLLLALAFGLSMPMIKVEGSLWMLLWLATLLLGILPQRLRLRSWMAPTALACLLVLGALLASIGLPIPGMGWVQVNAGELRITNAHSFVLGWQSGVIGPVLKSMFTLPNWNLLFWLAPMLLLWRWRTIRQSTGLGLMSLCLGGGVAFLFVLFFLTEAGIWARDYTSFNRLLLQLVPALVSLLVLAIRDPRQPAPDDTTD